MRVALKFAWVWLWVGTLMPALAQADSSVVVLGVRSLDGDDALAHDVSVALRTGAQKMQGWNVSQRDVSLAQMSLAHGCDEPDARCMADIAGTLEVDRLIYGTILKAGDEVQLSLFNFDAVTGHVETSLEQKVRAAEVAEPALDATVATLLRRLAGEKVAGMLRITGDSPGAKVTLDGEDAGALDVRGELLLTEVAAGKHELSVEAPSGRKDMSVNVAEGATSTVRVTLRAPSTLRVTKDSEAERAPDEPREGRPWRRPVGWTAVGLAGAFAVGTVVTWVGIDKINNDPDLKAYRNEYPKPTESGGTSDVCREAEDGTLELEGDASAQTLALEASARKLCNRADTLEILQYVFIGTAVLSGGVGAYLLLTTPKHKGQVSLRPRANGSSASLTATVRF
jgi:hypothetical protein